MKSVANPVKSSVAKKKQKISTHLYTVLTKCVIVQIEQMEKDKESKI